MRYSSSCLKIFFTFMRSGYFWMMNSLQTSWVGGVWTGNKALEPTRRVWVNRFRRLQGCFCWIRLKLLLISVASVDFVCDAEKPFVLVELDKGSQVVFFVESIDDCLRGALSGCLADQRLQAVDIYDIHQ